VSSSVRLFADPPAEAYPPIDELVELPVRAVTVSQPFAELIASGEKWVENRTWPTGYRGPVAIHAGKGLQYLNRRELERYYAGGVVAVAELVACVRLDRLQAGNPVEFQSLRDCGVAPPELLQHSYASGPWCWVLQDVQRCEFVPCRGALGLWKFGRRAF